MARVLSYIFTFFNISPCGSRFLMCVKKCGSHGAFYGMKFAYNGETPYLCGGFKNKMVAKRGGRCLTGEAFGPGKKMKKG